ncbi:polyprotein [Leanyer virus]|uniref:Envelopment polyprotein n=1 Tax=Leanyer virus TaxID=999729 RepID=F2WAD6_9VIRU|nr:polyprotein [Leanyer virus]AEA02983.1 polyprotein [Leanyer virus]QCT81306.1 glycoprotein [Leanyer virus]
MILSIILLLSSVNAVPVKERCFHGGILIADYNSTDGKGEMCIKDDVSMIKIKTQSQKDTKPNYNVKAYRLYTVKDWHDCNPVPDNTGTIQITSVSRNGDINSRIYSCRSACHITIDKEKAEIVLQSDTLNHYEVVGSTIMTGWFKKTSVLTLEHTCEELTIKCGQENLDLHSCFKVHRPCVRFFSGTYLPIFMIEKMCQNIELIILILYIIFAYIFAILITRSYIAYIFIPAFYPLVKLYSVLYNRFFKLCPNCLLALHPFSNCTNICICGSRFPSTEALKTHRLCKNCRGYKALTKTRYFCKNRLSSFMLAIMTGILLFSFVAPVKGNYSIRDLPEDLEILNTKLEGCSQGYWFIKILLSCLLATILIILIMSHLINRLIKDRIYRLCAFCGMIHNKKGLTFNSIITNKCGTCICGYTDHVYDGQDYEVARTLTHKTSKNCLTLYNKKFCKVTKLMLISLAILYFIPIVVAEINNCYKLEETSSSFDFSLCAGLDLNYTCSEINDPKVYIRNKLSTVEDEEGLMTILDMKPHEAYVKIENEPNIYTKMFLEHVYQAKQCNLLNGLKQHGGPANSGWRHYIRTHSLLSCGRVPQKFYCQCIQNDLGCDHVINDPLTKVNEFYRSNNEAFKSDMRTMQQTLGLAFQGMIKSIMDDLFFEATRNELAAILKRYLNKLEDNKPLKTVVMMTVHWLESNFSLSQRPEARSSPRASLGNKEETTQLIRGEEDITSCEQAKLLSCQVGKRLKLLEKYILCTASKHIYAAPEGYTYKNSQQRVCMDDVHCHIQFGLISQETLIKIKEANCYISDYPINNGDLINPMKFCSLERYGKCTTPAGIWPIAECANGNYYYSENPEHFGDGNITNFCLTPKCKEDRFKISPKWLLECNWNGERRQYNQLHVKKIYDFASYKEALKENIKTGLSEAKFYIANQIPKIIPTFKIFTIKGLDYQNGIQNAFVSSTIPVVAGISQGLTLTLPNGDILQDIILYIPKVTKTAHYTKLYDTGPTISIDMVHSEVCTGNCPNPIPKKRETWIPFSRSKTSRWGCEELGCLAVGTGCVFGSCTDIIKIDSTVYRKSGEEVVMVTICITDSLSSYCHNMDVLEPVETDKFSFTFNSQTVSNLPDLIYLKNRKAYKGQINNIGSFGDYCGNIQIINGTTYGIGNPRFDYICHAFKRKDIVISKCMDNNYQSCQFLQEVKNSKIELLDTEGTEINVHRHDMNLGTLNYKIELGDIDYKLFAKSNQLSVKSECAGCSKCTEAVICTLNVDSEGETVCKLASNCNSYTTQMKIPEGSSKHTIKLDCPREENIKLSICDTTVETVPVWKISKDKIDISSILEPTYIKEEDNRCGTWICRVKLEGFSFLSDFGYSIFGKYWHWFMISLMIVIVTIVSIYIFVPLCKRLKGCLEQNEKIYQFEMKQK